MSSWARVGAKCVCVDAEPMPGLVFMAPPPVKGQVYTITATFMGIWGVPTATLAGLPNERNGHDLGWSLKRFRPLVTRSQEQDVAMFKSLLTPAPELVE